MAQLKPLLTIPWYPLEEVAVAWGYSVLNLVAMGMQGQLEVIEEQALGRTFLAITAEERTRVEALIPAANVRDFRADAKRSYLELTAALLSYGFGDDLTNSDLRTTELEEHAARAGIPLGRCHKTYANIVREAVQLLRECGYIPSSPDGQTVKKHAA